MESNTFPSLAVGITTAVVLILSLIMAFYKAGKNRTEMKKKIAEEAQKKLGESLEQNNTTGITDSFDSLRRL